jgi:hypothetical protein
MAEQIERWDFTVEEAAKAARIVVDHDPAMARTRSFLSLDDEAAASAWPRSLLSLPLPASAESGSRSQLLTSRRQSG